MKKLMMLLVIAGMLIGAGCKKEKHITKTTIYTDTYEERRNIVEDSIAADESKKQPYQIKREKEIAEQEAEAVNAGIMAAWFKACETAAEYQLAGDKQNYLIWVREARRLAILLGY